MPEEFSINLIGQLTKTKLGKLFLYLYLFE